MALRHDSEVPLKAGIQFRFRGDSRDLRTLAVPFVEGAEDSLRKIGFVDSAEWLNSSAASGIPPRELTKRGQTIRADLGLSGILIGIIVFLGSTMGSWAISKVCDEIYENGIRPHLGALLGKLTKSNRSRAKNLVFQLGVWFAADKIYVQVVLETLGAEDGEKLQALIPQAFALAREWVEQHGVTHQFVTYRISHGQLLSTPQLSDTLPKQ